MATYQRFPSEVDRGRPGPSCAAAALVALVLCGTARVDAQAPPAPFPPPPVEADALLEPLPPVPPADAAPLDSPPLQEAPPSDAPPPTGSPPADIDAAADPEPPLAPLDGAPSPAPRFPAETDEPSPPAERFQGGLAAPPAGFVPRGASPNGLPADGFSTASPPASTRVPPGAERAADGTMSVLAAPPTATASPSRPLAPQEIPPPPAPSPAQTLLARGLSLPSVPGPAADPTSTRPLALLEALERSGDRSRRLWITQAYWKLAAAAARYRFAVDAEERLTLIAPGGGPDDLPLLDLATADARAEAASAGVDLVTAQQELVDLVRLPVIEPAPWPVDLPLTAAYQTHFETIFAARPATGRIRAIHRQLPLSHRALVARAEAAAAAEERFATAEAAHARGQSPIGPVLAAHDTIRAQEEAFVDAIRAYNLAIAEYVMAVADASVPDERFASMLIGQPRPWRQQVAPDRVVPVSASGLPGPPSPPFESAPGAAPRLLQPPPGFVPSGPPPAAAPGAAFPPGFAPLGG